MKLKVTKDVNKSKYYSVDVDIDSVDINGVTFKELLNHFLTTIPDADQFNKLLLKRNRNKYHITALSVPEFNKATARFENKHLPTVDIEDIEFVGIGSISRDDMTTFFVIVESFALQEIRRTSGIDEPRDLHITIGFTKRDLFHERKNTTNIFLIQK